MNKPMVQAHRGASKYAPENTLSAFKKAMEMGADGIELDIEYSKDRKIVVIHDFTVNRTSNGEGLVRDKTLEELKKLDFGSWYSEEFKDERISTLEEVLESSKDWNGFYNIEIKTPLNSVNDGIEKEVISLLEKYGRIESSIISSFNHYILKSVKQLCPPLKVGLLYAEAMIDPADYALKVGAEFIHPSFKSVNEEIVRDCINKGIGVNVWTIDRPDDIKRAASAGVTGIITNVPDVAQKNI